MRYVVKGDSNVFLKELRYRFFQWFTWSRLFMNKDPTGEYPDAYFVGYIFYVLFAILFSAVCVLLVRMFAPYACGKWI